MDVQLQIRKLMQEYLVSAQSRNPGYSLRAFSRRIGLYSSTVSEILSGRRPITRKMAERILCGLGTAPDQASQILEILSQKDSRQSQSGSRSLPTGETLKYTQIKMDQFHVISDWYYFAILSLADCDVFQGEPEWVAERIGIKAQDARVALERLERLEMLVRDQDGNLRPTGKQFKTSEDIANISLRKRHYQNLELARRSLDRDSVEEREFTFITMAVDPLRISEMKKRIREFRDSFCQEFESGQRKEVFKMCVQLFPLSELKTEGVSHE
jgi:uncharacterized protein (TIGR02147 family)